MNKAVKDLIEISQYAGRRVDYTQGGGGNTSVKDGGVMYIKASGFRLKDIDENTAYVPMDLEKIRNFFDKVDLSDGKDHEAENKAVTAEATLKREGLAPLRPSVEVGFHSVLKKYVIHTHSVYANLLTCAVRGKELAEKIFAGADFDYIFMPYIDPGFTLSVKMKEAVSAYEKATGRYPEVIFMQNHGLVVSADTIERVKAVNEEVNIKIAAFFAIKDGVDAVCLKEEGEGKYLSQTPLIGKFVKENGLTKALLDEYPLYPDQLVYLNNVINFAPEKLVCDGESVRYNTNEKEATTLEETLFAYLFVISVLKKHGEEISTMSEKDVDFINNWEAEKYRRSLSK
ncbi:MAG: class II aldolase [Clostridia bacterium]|nr:class II aldolase [Clostridia bacterium]